MTASSDLSMTITRGDDDSSYVVRARAPLDISCANAMALLTSRDGAAAFRDIGAYDSYEAGADGGVSVTYTAGWGPVKVQVGLHLASRGAGTLTFKSTTGMPTSGSWTFRETGPRSCVASLSQTLVPRGIAAWVPLASLLRGRVRRAFEDLQRARGKTLNKA
jgi:hypothetical protein